MLLDWSSCIEFVTSEEDENAVWGDRNHTEDANPGPRGWLDATMFLVWNGVVCVELQVTRMFSIISIPPGGSTSPRPHTVLSVVDDKKMFFVQSRVAQD